MILNEIVKDKRLELEAQKQAIPFMQVKKSAFARPTPRDMVSVLRDKKGQIIAEVKKASPSKGVIRQDFDPVEIARVYAENRAAAISVLTEMKYFQGSLDHIKQIDHRLPRVRPPLLRKDFIFDPYQVYETRACGADALLLIVSILKLTELQELIKLSHGLGLSCLVEVHTEEEVKIAVSCGAGIIGINNRDLNTFKVDIGTTKRLRALIPPDRIAVSESGISTHDDMAFLTEIGVNAVLIGEALLSSANIADKMRELSA